VLAADTKPKKFSSVVAFGSATTATGRAAAHPSGLKITHDFGGADAYSGVAAFFPFVTTNAKGSFENALLGTGGLQLRQTFSNASGRSGFSGRGSAVISSTVFEGSSDTAVGLAITVSPVPDPATWVMLVLGFGAIGAAMRSRSKALNWAYKVRQR
jgi:hypothetical protein